MNIFFGLILFLGFWGTAFCTVLGDLSASMKPGEWKELQTKGFTYDLLNAGNGHHILQWTDDAMWDPNSRQLLFMGGGHASADKFISYSDETNTWREEPLPSWAGNDAIQHGYDHNAIDPVNGFFYHHPASARKMVYRYFIDQKMWRVALNLPDNIVTWEMMDCCVGFGYFPEIQSLVIANSRPNAVYLFDTMKGKFTVINDLPMSYGNIAKYNPVHKVMWFGGGSGGYTSYRLDQTGKATKLQNAPVMPMPGPSVQTVDPVTGTFLVFDENRSFYHFDILKDSWTRQSGSVPFFDVGPNGATFGTVATPVSTYGVVMFATFDNNQPKVHVYKHAQMKLKVDKKVPPSKVDFGAFPNPFRKTVNFDWPSSKIANTSLEIFNSSGQLVKSLKNGKSKPKTSWSPQGLSPGIYFAKLKAPSVVLWKKLFLLN